MCTPKIKSLATFNPLEQKETQNNMVTTGFHCTCPLKEPGCPNESLGVQKQADTQHSCDFCKQKTAEVGTAGPKRGISAAVRKPLILIG